MLYSKGAFSASFQTPVGRAPAYKSPIIRKHHDKESTTSQQVVEVWNERHYIAANHGEL